MEWKKIDPELKKLLEDTMQSFHCEKRMMFGAPTYFINNNMFVGIHENKIIIRLSEKDRGEIIAGDKRAKPFEPMPGRVMKEYIALPESIYNDRNKLVEWLTRSYGYTSALPAKERKRNTRKKSTS
jgi:TfoX/Sxy family transcriptional regulator of competence genes